MTGFATVVLADAPVVTAPDGALVHVLAKLAGGSFAQFSLTSGQTSQAVRHRTVEEIWFVVAGEGEMWRRQDGREEITRLAPGTCVTIPAGCAFQFRATGPDGVAAIAATMPPWPLDREEAVPCAGAWPAAGA